MTERAKKRKWVEGSPTRLLFWRPDRKAGTECVRHFVRQAAERKRWLASAAGQRALKSDSPNMDASYAKQDARRSVHALARQSLEYLRYRAYLTNGAGGSYCPQGWPLDKPARADWFRLNPHLCSANQPSVEDSTDD